MLSAAGILVVVLVALASIGTSSRAAGETLMANTFITAYTWQDNTPPGSPEISNPVLHAQAGGTGTYEDSVTIAVGHSRATGQDVLDLPAGTRIYLPDVRRYFIVEDTCGDGPAPENGPCHTGAHEQGNASLWIDMWIGGGGENASFVNECTRAVTGVRAGLLNPAPTYAVAPGAGVIHDGKCDSGYGNGIVAR
ncbi:MAG: hypothetical protein ABI568_03285 [Pseudarthrobacter sp.]